MNIRKVFKAGFGRTDVTPELGVRLGGYGVKERPAEEIIDHLHSTAMVLEQDGIMAAVINLDWICIDEDIVERIRCGINQRTGIQAKNISVCTTHSHSVPNTLSFWGWGERENTYIDSVLPEVIRHLRQRRLVLDDLGRVVDLKRFVLQQKVGEM